MNKYFKENQNVGVLKSNPKHILVVDKKVNFEIIDSSYCAKLKKLYLMFKIEGYDGVIANYFNADSDEYQILLNRLFRFEDGEMAWIYENDFIGIKGKANIYFYNMKPCVEPITIELVDEYDCETEYENYNDCDCGCDYDGDCECEYEDDYEADCEYEDDEERTIFTQDPQNCLNILSIEEVMKNAN